MYDKGELENLQQFQIKLAFQFFYWKSKWTGQDSSIIHCNIIYIGARLPVQIQRKTNSKGHQNRFLLTTVPNICLQKSKQQSLSKTY